MRKENKYLIRLLVSQFNPGAVITADRGSVADYEVDMVPMGEAEKAALSEMFSSR